MSLPNITIIQGTGGLGRTLSIEDSVSGLLLSGIATANIGLLEAKMITSEDDLATLAILDADNHLAYSEIKAFYKHAPRGTKLWIMLAADTVVLADYADKTKEYAKKLLEAANGNIKLLGLNRIPPAGYTPTRANNFDGDVVTAIANLKLLQADFAAKHAPFTALLPHLGFVSADVDDTKDLRTLTSNGVGVVSFCETNDGAPAVGLVLGKMAAVAVQHSPGAVRDGDLLIDAAYYPDATTQASLLGKLEALADKGLILGRTYVGKSGYYLTGDPNCAPKSDDINRLGLQRVFDKASRIAYNVYVDELLSDVEVDATTGQLSSATCAYFESIIENAINQQMQNEISGTAAVIEADQNIITSGKLAVKLKIVPLGLIEAIEVTIGFTTEL